MRKLQQVALVFAAAGGLSAIGAGASQADAPGGYGAAPPAPQSQPDAPQATSWTASGATAHSSGSQYGAQQTAPQAAPGQPPQLAPQVNPQLNPKLSPQITSPQGSPASGSAEQNNLFRPYQECSPQTLLDADLPVSVLGVSQSKGTTCGQANYQANAFAKTR